MCARMADEALNRVPALAINLYRSAEEMNEIVIHLTDWSVCTLSYMCRCMHTRSSCGLKITKTEFPTDVFFFFFKEIKSTRMCNRKTAKMSLTFPLSQKWIQGDSIGCAAPVTCLSFSFFSPAVVAAITPLCDATALAYIEFPLLATNVLLC